MRKVDCHVTVHVRHRPQRYTLVHEFLLSTVYYIMTRLNNVFVTFSTELNIPAWKFSRSFLRVRLPRFSDFPDPDELATETGLRASDKISEHEGVKGVIGWLARDAISLAAAALATAWETWSAAEKGTSTPPWFEAGVPTDVGDSEAWKAALELADKTAHVGLSNFSERARCVDFCCFFFIKSGFFINVFFLTFLFSKSIPETFSTSWKSASGKGFHAPWWFKPSKVHACPLKKVQNLISFFKFHPKFYQPFGYFGPYPKTLPKSVCCRSRQGLVIPAVWFIGIFQALGTAKLGKISWKLTLIIYF